MTAASGDRWGRAAHPGQRAAPDTAAAARDQNHDCRDGSDAWAVFPHGQMKLQLKITETAAPVARTVAHDVPWS